ncbi:MAG: thiol-disulfide oxidoreductase DCC family protein [Phycisphaerales bacterium]
MTRDTCYYDGRCGLCRRSVRWLRRLDWLGCLVYADMNAVPRAELPYPIEEAMRGMPMRTRNGGRLIGFPAVRRALIQTPLGALGAWALYLPGVSHLGAIVYRHVAINRRRDACGIHPPAALQGDRP